MISCADHGTGLQQPSTYLAGHEEWAFAALGDGYGDARNLYGNAYIRQVSGSGSLRNEPLRRMRQRDKVRAGGSGAVSLRYRVPFGPAARDRQGEDLVR